MNQETEREYFELWAIDMQYDMRVFRYMPFVFVDARTEAAWQAWITRAEAANKEVVEYAC